ncbi:PREDICTED: TLC domain-containing protein 2-like [Priapulus caudatus]|uniref:TLC domain-containing protein 2-like n=1 Tax=Priapulus caudatus TaxID=37621 RepID=A0ABM1EVJ9_PRICU|nr:PREDICTED: TLC domain-containing protein 2-like [Priapulus caudatus]
MEEYLRVVDPRPHRWTLVRSPDVLPPDMLEDLYTYKSASAFALSAFSTAYFFYDFIDIIFGIGFITHWEVCIHHIPVCIGMLYNVMCAGYIGYHAMVLSLEVNSVFLHIRKIMHMTQAYGPHSWQYRLNALLNLVTFAISASERWCG